MNLLPSGYGSTACTAATGFVGEGHAGECATEKQAPKARRVAPPQCVRERGRVGRPGCRRGTTACPSASFSSTRPTPARSRSQEPSLRRSLFRNARSLLGGSVVARRPPSLQGCAARRARGQQLQGVSLRKRGFVRDAAAPWATKRATSRRGAALAARWGSRRCRPPPPPSALTSPERQVPVGGVPEGAGHPPPQHQVVRWLDPGHRPPSASDLHLSPLFLQLVISCALEQPQRASAPKRTPIP